MPHYFVINDEQTRANACKLIAGLDLKRPWRVEVGVFRPRRTTNQNNLMWAWINEVADHVREHTGQDSDEIHEFFKAKFLPAKIVEINGESFDYRTTTKLTTAEMSDYMDRIYFWATTELGLILPVPEDLGASKDKDQRTASDPQREFTDDLKSRIEHSTSLDILNHIIATNIRSIEALDPEYFRGIEAARKKKADEFMVPT